jgi:hypothetical protein
MRFIVIFFLFISSLTHAFEKDVIIDLKDATFEDGVLHTCKGGKISEGCLTIQARCITYQKKNDSENCTEKVWASKDILVLFKDKLLTGSKVEYDFEKEEGFLYDGIVVQEPFVVGGKKIRFRKDGTYKIYDGFATLCDSHESNFSIRAKTIRILKNSMVVADGIHLSLFDIPLFSFPDLRSTTNSLTDLPILIGGYWGGVEGSYVTLRYRFITHENFKAFLRADYVFGRGPGGGLDFDLCCKEANRYYKAKNFGVYDRSYDDPRNRFRYRFEGMYNECFPSENITARLSYDFLSDTEMGSDFSSDEFNLDTGNNTELIISKKEKSWIADFATRVRVNSFQTINQELPSLTLGFKPLSIDPVKIISDTKVKMAYLNYAYADGTPNISDFDSTRCELDQNFYRPFKMGRFSKFTPEVGGFLIHYGNDMYGSSAMQAIGYFGFTLDTALYKSYSNFKHILEPYMQFQGYTSPTVSQTTAPIFNIWDGYSRLDLLRVGMTNSIFEKTYANSIIRTLWIDLYFYAFWGINTVEKRVPRVYSDITWQPTQNLLCRLEMGYNRETENIDLFNLYSMYTFNEDLSFGIDLLSRGPRYWRKCQYDNFMLDAFRSESELENSPLSDRRNTLIGHLFYRFHPNWRLEARTRYGWNRQYQNPYFEYKLDLETFIGCNWRFKFGYEHREIDDRFIFSFKLGQQRPGEGLFN